MAECIDHLEFTGKYCPDCGLAVDDYGNTEAQFEYCSFPDCGCDGARLCMAKRGPSDNAQRGNVEGMWSNGSKAECRKAVEFTVTLCAVRKEKEAEHETTA